MYQYLRLCATFEAREAGSDAQQVQPPIIRRVMGKALVELFCPFGKPVCQRLQRPGLGRDRPPLPCSMACSCPYGVLYAGSLNDRPPFAVYLAVAAGPVPAVEVEVTVYGPAWRTYGWLLAGLCYAMAHGVGRRRTTWRLKHVRQVAVDGRDKRLCGANLAALPPELAPDELSLSTQGRVAPAQVEVELLSPARIIRDGAVVCDDQPIPFELLIARILDRFTGLYGRGDNQLADAKARADLEAEAAKVALVDHAIRWVDVDDYSARQGSRMTLGGKVGRMVFSEVASALLPILKAGEILHVGKNPTSGCGRLRVVVPREGVRNCE